MYLENSAMCLSLNWSYIRRVLRDKCCFEHKLKKSVCGLVFFFNNFQTLILGFVMSGCFPGFVFPMGPWFRTELWFIMYIVSLCHRLDWFSLVLPWFSTLRIPFFLFLIYSQLEFSLWKKNSALLQWFLAIVSFYAPFSHSVNMLTFS